MKLLRTLYSLYIIDTESSGRLWYLEGYDVSSMGPYSQGAVIWYLIWKGPLHQTADTEYDLWNSEAYLVIYRMRRFYLKSL